MRRTIFKCDRSRVGIKKHSQDCRGKRKWFHISDWIMTLTENITGVKNFPRRPCLSQSISPMDGPLLLLALQVCFYFVGGAFGEV
jgi:hypothetical protein